MTGANRKKARVRVNLIARVLTRRRTAALDARDAGHEAVGQALLISIGVGAMLAAGRLADVAMAGLTVVSQALR